MNRQQKAKLGGRRLITVLIASIGFYCCVSNKQTIRTIFEAVFQPEAPPGALLAITANRELFSKVDTCINSVNWISSTVRRLGKVKKICGTLCTLNSWEAVEAYQAPKNKGHFSTVQITDLSDRCPMITVMEEIDETETDGVFCNKVPPILIPYYSMNGSAVLEDVQIHKDIHVGKSGDVWTRAMIESQIDAAINNKLEGTYCRSCTLKIKRQLSKISMMGKSILVIGSDNPWIEAICLSLGARHVTTLEYAAIRSDHPRISIETPQSFREKIKNGQLKDFDGVVSHSSIEHSGLGRYGDALNPWGDLLAVARAWCVTKPGGFLYLGLPTGKDSVTLNAHRIYGRKRWTLIAANWRQIHEETDGTELDRVFPDSGECGGHGYLFEKPFVLMDPSGLSKDVDASCHG